MDKKAKSTARPASQQILKQNGDLEDSQNELTGVMSTASKLFDDSQVGDESQLADETQPDDDAQSPPNHDVQVVGDIRFGAVSLLNGSCLGFTGKHERTLPRLGN